MIKRRCPYCEKIVRDKWIFGTLHLCLLPHERAAIEQRAARIAGRYEAAKSGQLGKSPHPLVAAGFGGIKNYGPDTNQGLK